MIWFMIQNVMIQNMCLPKKLRLLWGAHIVQAVALRFGDLFAKSHQAKVWTKNKASAGETETYKQTLHIYIYIHPSLHYFILSCSSLSVISDIEKIWKNPKTDWIKTWIPELGLEANELQGLNDISQEYIIAFVCGPRDVVRLKSAEVVHTTLGTLGTNTLSAARIPLTLTGEAFAPKRTGTYEVFEHKLDALYLSTCKLIVYW